MSDDKTGGESLSSQQELETIIAEADTGGRKPSGISAKVLWICSSSTTPLPCLMS
jgi:hypothetical protein